MRFAITGSTGLVGGTLVRFLRTQGHDVTRVVRSFGGLPPGERAVVWHPERGVIEGAGLEGHDVVIHTAGESIAGVWTEGKKRRIRESRVRGTTLLAQTLAGLERKPRAVFSASAMGIYGDRGSAELDESTPEGTGFLADVAKAWEASTSPARDAGIRVVHMRFGNVLSREGGMLEVLLPLFRLGLGAKLGSGGQFWPWIAADDIGPAILHLLARPEISGPVNFVAPETATNAQFTEALAAAAGRPSILSVPKFATRFAPGGMADELLLSSLRLVPRKLVESGYDFRHPRLRDALRDIVRS